MAASTSPTDAKLSSEATGDQTATNSIGATAELAGPLGLEKLPSVLPSSENKGSSAAKNAETAKTLQFLPGISPVNQNPGGKMSFDTRDFDERGRRGSETASVSEVHLDCGLDKRHSSGRVSLNSELENADGELRKHSSESVVSIVSTVSGDGLISTDFGYNGDDPKHAPCRTLCDDLMHHSDMDEFFRSYDDESSLVNVASSRDSLASTSSAPLRTLPTLTSLANDRKQADIKQNFSDGTRRFSVPTDDICGNKLNTKMPATNSIVFPIISDDVNSQKSIPNIPDADIIRGVSSPVETSSSSEKTCIVSIPPITHPVPGCTVSKEDLEPNRIVEQRNHTKVVRSAPFLVPPPRFSVDDDEEDHVWIEVADTSCYFECPELLQSFRSLKPRLSYR
ncbi:uncharacterized protein LOC108680426 [Hyalella azteca]|uniref:Uncharacterized protein LOC108680426 n=1 Tax=Hyalella azteca TaxID=294128 RepID=A0A8B7PF25_HYAAZ|nr:uncharacterized protein LOC108680426 [Hyalella azteca]